MGDRSDTQTLARDDCSLIKPCTQLGNAAQRVCRDCLEPPHTEHAS